MKLRFSKMHGIGNDFVIIDCREHGFSLSSEQIRVLGDRHTGIGFDQLLTIEPADDTSCAFRYGIYNQDGSPAMQCGNGARCVVAWLVRAGLLDFSRVTRLQSPVGPVTVKWLDTTQIRVVMGVPQFDPDRIPLCTDTASEHYTLDIDGSTIVFGAVSLGNPHAVVETVDCAVAPVSKLGPAIERHGFFPQGCNVEFAQILGRDSIRLRVWERGVGETLACGSGACAAVAVLRRQNKVDARVRVLLPGGELEIFWEGAGHPLWMSGPAAFVFEGECLL